MKTKLNNAVLSFIVVAGFYVLSHGQQKKVQSDSAIQNQLTKIMKADTMLEEFDLHVLSKGDNTLTIRASSESEKIGTKSDEKVRKIIEKNKLEVKRDQHDGCITTESPIILPENRGTMVLNLTFKPGAGKTVAENMAIANAKIKNIIQSFHTWLLETHQEL